MVSAESSARSDKKIPNDSNIKKTSIQNKPTPRFDETCKKVNAIINKIYYNAAVEHIPKLVKIYVTKYNSKPTLEEAKKEVEENYAWPIDTVITPDLIEEQ